MRAAPLISRRYRLRCRRSTPIWGIAFDGDADRVLMVDHSGAVVDGDELLFIIARDLQERGKLQGGVVGHAG